MPTDSKGNNALNTLGVFSEMNYVSIGDGYKSNVHANTFNLNAHKGKQMLPGGTKIKCGGIDGFFNDFQRVMEGEAYTEVGKRIRQERLKQATKNKGKAFVPSHGDIKPNGIGSNYGTFGGAIPAFDPAVRGQQKHKASKRNIMTNPSKSGSGYGYIDVTINPYPSYSSENYDTNKNITMKEIEKHYELRKGGAFKPAMRLGSYFDPNPFRPAQKQPTSRSPRPSNKQNEIIKPFKPSSPSKSIGGCKAGCFSHYPIHTEEGRGKPAKKYYTGKPIGKGAFVPSQVSKSTPIKSVLNMSITRNINPSNYTQQHHPLSV